MEGISPIARMRPLIIPAILTALSGSGCARDRASARPIAPFGTVRTYNSTVVPGPAGHPRGQMIAPQAPGIDLVRSPGPTDPQPESAIPSAVDLSTLPAAAVSLAMNDPAGVVLQRAFFRHDYQVSRTDLRTVGLPGTPRATSHPSVEVPGRIVPGPESRAREIDPSRRRMVT